MKLGIIGAEKQEVELLFAALAHDGSPVTINKKGTLEFHQGSLKGCPVVVVCSGIGKVNAALCAQILISEFSVDCVVNTGSAGGIDPSLEVLDMIVSTDAVQHDFDLTVFGYKPGQIPGTDSPFFAADSALRARALEAFDRLAVSATCGGSSEANGVGNAAQHKMIAGRIASGDSFITDDASRARIVKTFAPACVEMEGAAIAQVCTLNSIPFVILRSISDLAGESAGMSYDEFSKLASWTSAHVVMEMAAKLTGGI